MTVTAVLPFDEVRAYLNEVRGSSRAAGDGGLPGSGYGGRRDVPRCRPGDPSSRPSARRAESVDFAVDLSQAEDFNLSFGTRLKLNDGWEGTVEVGTGDRNTVLANITYRFE